MYTYVMKRPQVTQLNDNTQIFDGYRYFADKKGRPYYRRQVRKDGKLTTVSIHREVWRYHYGDIPTGWHIHHRDHDWHNNEIDNLVMITQRKHLSYHWQDEAKREKARENLKKVRHLADAWHKDPKNKQFHVDIAKKSWENKKLTTIDCAHCHTKFDTPFPERTRFCSDNCKMKARTRRLKGLAEDAPRATIIKNGRIQL